MHSLTKLSVPLFMAISLSACGGTGSSAPRSASGGYISPVQTKLDPRGLESVLGQDAGTLISQFGQPRLDVVEEYGRKLQFSGDPCILDTYLYPDKSGKERVTHVDARNKDGAAVDRAACVNALRAER